MRFIVLCNIGETNWLVYDTLAHSGREHVAEFIDKEAAENLAEMLNSVTEEETARLLKTLYLFRFSLYSK